MKKLVEISCCDGEDLERDLLCYETV
jgi:hypothetical protein